MPEGEPWEDHHHHSHLQDYEEDNIIELHHPSIKILFLNSFPINVINSERNLSNIQETISIDIRINPTL